MGETVDVVAKEKEHHPFLWGLTIGSTSTLTVLLLWIQVTVGFGTLLSELGFNAHFGRRGAKQAFERYYDAIAAGTTSGYTTAWGLLTDARRAQFAAEQGWTSADDFKRGYRTTRAYEYKDVRIIQESTNVVQGEEILFGVDELPSSPAKSVLETSPARDLLNGTKYQQLERSVLAAMEANYVITNAQLAKVRTVLPTLTIDRMLLPDLLESLAERAADAKGQTLAPNSTGSSAIASPQRKNLTRWVWINRRSFERNQNGEWHLGQSTPEGVAVLRDSN